MAVAANFNNQINWKELARLGIVIGILLIGFLILSHEAGHMAMARILGIRVNEFAIGMGPKIWGFARKGTAYNLRAIPVGGFCALEGEDGSEDPLPDSFAARPKLDRALVLLAGPLVNIITAGLAALGLVLAAGANKPVAYGTVDYIDSGVRDGDVILAIDGNEIATGRDAAAYEALELGHSGSVRIAYLRDGEVLESEYGTAYSRPVIGVTYTEDENPAAAKVREGGPAWEAGLRSGDIITSLGGIPVRTGSDLGIAFDRAKAEGGEIEITAERNGEELCFTATPEIEAGHSLGFRASGYRDKDLTAGETLAWSLRELISMEKQAFASPKALIAGRVSLKDMSGPIGIVGAVSDNISNASGFRQAGMGLLNVLALIGANLGIMNLLPIPALDGGRLLFILIELLRGKKMRPRIEAMLNGACLGLLLLLMGFVFVMDGVKLIAGG